MSSSENSQKTNSNQKIIKRLSDPQVRVALRKHPYLAELAEMLLQNPSDSYIADLFELKMSNLDTQIHLSEDPFTVNYPLDNQAGQKESFIRLGTTPNDLDAGVYTDQLSSNGIISGNTGSGKTTALKHLLCDPQLICNNRVIAVVRKKEIRDLAFIPEISLMTQVFRAEDLSISILQPWKDGLQKEFINILSRIFALSFNKISAQHYLNEKLHEIIQIWPKNSYPSLNQIIQYLKQKDWRGYNYRREQLKDSCINSLTAIEDNLGAQMWNYSSSNMLHILFSTPGLAVLELEGIDPQVLSFLSIYLMYWRYYYVQYSGSKSLGDIPAVFILDDATPCVQREADRNAPSGIGPVGDIVTMSRSSQQGTIVIAHSLDNASEPIIQNSSFIVVAGSRGESSYKLKNILNITDRQLEYLKIMPQNQALLYNPSMCEMPVLFEYSPFNNYNLSENNRINSLKRFLTFVKTTPPVNPTVNGKTQYNNSILKEAKELIRVTCRIPNLSVTALYKKLGWRAAYGVKIKKYLLKHNFIKEFRYSTGSVGAMVHVLLATEKGKKLVSHNSRALTNGGMQHEMAAYAVSDALDSDVWRIDYEVPLSSNLRMDIVAENKRNAQKLFINIGISRPENELQHFLDYVNLRNRKYASFILICRDTRFRKQFLSKLKKEKNYYRPKGCRLSEVILLNTRSTFPSILSFFFQYLSHWSAEVKRLIMILAILAAPSSLQPKAIRFRRRASSRIIRSIILEARGPTIPVRSQRRI
jgi:hypothetical protein